MKRVVIYALVAGALLAAAVWWQVFRDDPAMASERMDAMAVKCVQEYVGQGAVPHDDESIAEAERIWEAPLSSDMIPVGGVDLPGWAKACQYDPERPDLLKGEYRDRSLRYVGRFQLRMEDDTAIPTDALEAFYASHFVAGSGLVMYPHDTSRPRIPRLIAAPIDPDGYISR